MTVAAPDMVRLGSPDSSNAGDSPLLLTVEEAAQRLRIGRTRMFTLVTSGAVGSVFIGRSRRVPVECLTEYVTRLRAAAGQFDQTTPEGSR